MAYSRTNWKDNDSTTPLSAANMNNIEDGVEENKNAISVLKAGTAMQSISNSRGEGTTVTVQCERPISEYQTIFVEIEKYGITNKGWSATFSFCPALLIDAAHNRTLHIPVATIMDNAWLFSVKISYNSSYPRNFYISSDFDYNSNNEIKVNRVYGGGIDEN